VGRPTVNTAELAPYDCMTWTHGRRVAPRQATILGRSPCRSQLGVFTYDRHGHLSPKWTNEPQQQLDAIRTGGLVRAREGVAAC
jgi:hypothetical protein